MHPCLRPWQTAAYRPSDQYVVQDTGSCLISPGPRTLDHQRRRIEIGPDNRSIVSSAKIIQRVLRAYILQSHPGSVTERRRLVPCQRSDEPLTQAEGCGSFVLCCESGFIFFKFSVEGRFRLPPLWKGSGACGVRRARSGPDADPVRCSRHRAPCALFPQM